jgi:hypothetical protein
VNNVTVSGRKLFGQRYVLPEPVAAALEQVFEEAVGTVSVVEYSLYARLHLGMSATTRPNRILLAISGTEFVSNPELLLHEYFHVLRQWGTGRLTRWRYLVESARRGYWNNQFEREAQEFSAAAVDSYREYLNDRRRPRPRTPTGDLLALNSKGR